MSDDDDDLNLDSDDQSFPDYDQEEATRLQQQADANAQVRADVLENARYDGFFAPYHPRVREHFARFYALKRGVWMERGDDSERFLSHKLSWFAKDAYTRLWDIQQKKLFDLQCQWRAEQVAVPDVNIGADFGTLSLAIENCAALSPITPEEFARYLDWARQAAYTDLNDLHDARYAWQNYEVVKAALHGTPPEATLADIATAKAVSGWYGYHNAHTASGNLLALPDRRGDKEKALLAAWHEGRKKEAELEKAVALAAGTPPDPAADPRPQYLPTEEEAALQVEFARRFEPAKVNRQRESYEAAHPPVTPEQQELQRISTFLTVVDEPVPIEADPDWREAVRRAYQAFYHRKLLETLPHVYEEYCQRQEWGISHPTRHSFERHDLSGIIRSSILEAREWLGQPRDFNF